MNCEVRCVKKWDMGYTMLVFIVYCVHKQEKWHRFPRELAYKGACLCNYKTKDKDVKLYLSNLARELLRFKNQNESQIVL